MENSRTKNSILILITGVSRQLLTILLTFVSRTVFIYVLGAEILGINGLFTNILSLLSLSELGIATAITFYLYKPIADQNIERINLLMNFYKLCYRGVGLVILGIGLLITPFLKYIVNFDQNIDINLYIVYFISVFNISSTYLFGGYKQTIFLANQEQYKAESVNICFALLNCIAEIISLLVFKNYIVYLVTQLTMVLIKNLTFVRKANKEYPYLKLPCKGRLNKIEIKRFFLDIYQVAIFKLGSQLLNATSNIVISILLGTIIVGYYSNYYLIISALISLYNVIIRSFTAGIGNVIVKETKEKQFLVYKRLNFANFLLSSLLTVGLSQIFNSFMRIWLGNVSEAYILSQPVVTIISINYFFDTSCQILNTFREASGNFKVGYLLQAMAGVVNIALSIILGWKFGLAGILISIVVCKFFITIIPFIKSIANTVFKMKSTWFIFDYIKNFVFTLACILIVWKCCYRFHSTSIVGLLIEICITIMVFGFLVVAFYGRSNEFIYFIKRIFALLKKFFR